VRIKRWPAICGGLGVSVFIVANLSAQGAGKRRTTADVVADFQASTGLVSAVGAGGTESSTGSGFFVSPDGSFVTNRHVIAGAITITVKRPSGETYRVVGIAAADEQRDLAILQVEGRGFKPAELGSSVSVYRVSE